MLSLKHIDLFHLLSTGTMKCFIPSSTLNMCRSKITAEQAPCTLSSWCVHFNRLRGKKQTVERSFYEIKLPVLYCSEAVHVAVDSEGL